MPNVYYDRLHERRDSGVYSELQGKGGNVAHLEVTCITKRTDHYDPHQRIEALGGAGWRKTEDVVISEIERGTNSYYVSVSGRPVQLAVSIRQGRKYLKTMADGYVLNNLLALPDCRR